MTEAIRAELVMRLKGVGRRTVLAAVAQRPANLAFKCGEPLAPHIVTFFDSGSCLRVSALAIGHVSRHNGQSASVIFGQLHMYARDSLNELASDLDNLKVDIDSAPTHNILALNGGHGEAQLGCEDLVMLGTSVTLVLLLPVLFMMLGMERPVDGLRRGKRGVKRVRVRVQLEAIEEDPVDILRLDLEEKRQVVGPMSCRVDLSVMVHKLDGTSGAGQLNQLAVLGGEVERVDNVDVILGDLRR